MENERLSAFLSVSTQDRFRLALEGNYTEDLKNYLGEPVFEEYVKIAAKTLQKLDQKYLGLNAPTNLLFVPGVMGSLMHSPTRSGVWWVDLPRMATRLNELKLAPNGQDDAIFNLKLAPFNIDVTYEPFLAAILERDDFGHETFPYDWRKPLTYSADSLRGKIFALYKENGGKPIHLVAHSMGGLMVRAALMDQGSELWSKIGRIVFIGTPHYGSPAIASYLKNHLWGFDLMLVLGRLISPETFRSLWGVLSMLPAPRGIYPGTRPTDPIPWKSDNPTDSYIHPCSNFDLYKVQEWQLNNLSTQETSNLDAVLQGVADFHQKMYEAHIKLNQEFRDRMAVIAGVGYDTLFRMSYQPGFLGLWQDVDKVTTRIQGDPHREGDGRVPLASACLEYVGETRYIKGVHGDLPMMSEVYEDVFRWLNNQSMKLPSSAGMALSQHLGGGLPMSQAFQFPQLPRANRATGNPGYWQLHPANSSMLTQIETELNSGKIPEFNQIRLL